MTEIKPDVTLDCKGMNCPMPVLNTKKIVNYFYLIVSKLKNYLTSLLIYIIYSKQYLIKGKGVYVMKWSL
jgi:hypothetical protein